MLQRRMFPIGAELDSSGAVHFRVWAPRSNQIAVELHDAAGASRTVALEAEGGGYFSGTAPEVRAGARYKFRLERGTFPDPASRFQPDGVHGPSQIVDPRAFRWTDGAWRGRKIEELVIYELHLGTFTREGSWRAAMDQLPELARFGVTMIEVMPVAEFSGRFGWGYDGVGLYAPTRLYGTPDDARAFVDRAHALGIAVILDVVYNHLGPDGNYLREFSPDYFSARYATEWGDPLNFDGENAGPVREYFVTNARYWIEEFHLDGLRLDATQQIFDRSPTHVLAEVAAAAQRAGGGREIFVVGENETQDTRLVRPAAAGGYGLDALWNDDFHHTAIVAATGRTEAYYSGYRGTAQELVSATKHGFLFQGQLYRWQKDRRGRPAFDLRPRNFVTFLENHDQVANSLHGLRLHQRASPAKVRALTVLLLLSPQIPMFFQGQEFAASAPFLYFADHGPGLREAIAEGRRKFLRQFSSIATPEAVAAMADIGDVATFERCCLDFNERARHAPVYRLHEELLRLRREDPVIAKAGRLDGAVLGERAFVLRFFADAGGDRMLIVNLGADLAFEGAEPLLAPVDGHGWRILLSSEAPAYGGGGTPPLETQANWNIPADSAVLFAPDEKRALPPAKFSEKD